MKYIYLFTCFFLYSYTISAQVLIQIDSLFINNVDDSQKIIRIPITDSSEIYEIHSEDKEHGPYVNIYATFENLFLDTLLLDTILDFDLMQNPEGGIYITFTYKGKVYEIMPTTIYPVGKNILLPQRSLQVHFGDWIFLGTNIKKEGGYNYSKEVIETLPTLQVVFKYKNKIYKSKGISKVIYMDN